MLRFWDGSKWTVHYAPAPRPARAGGFRPFRRSGDPPSAFHRWLAEHPFQWAAIVAGFILVASLSSSRARLDGFEWVFVAGALVAYALAALVGALLTRRMVSKYDGANPDHA
jgi:hypothetical protein